MVSRGVVIKFLFVLLLNGCVPSTPYYTAQYPVSTAPKVETTSVSMEIRTLSVTCSPMYVRATGKIGVTNTSDKLLSIFQDDFRVRSALHGVDDRLAYHPVSTKVERKRGAYYEFVPPDEEADSASGKTEPRRKMRVRPDWRVHLVHKMRLQRDSLAYEGMFLGREECFSLNSILEDTLTVVMPPVTREGKTILPRQEIPIVYEPDSTVSNES